MMMMRMKILLRPEDLLEKLKINSRQDGSLTPEKKEILKQEFKMEQ